MVSPHKKADLGPDELSEPFTIRLTKADLTRLRRIAVDRYTLAKTGAVAREALRRGLELMERETTGGATER